MTSGIPLPWFLLLPLFIAKAMYWPFKSAHSAYENFKNWRKYRPVRPVPRTRRRALTLPLPESSYRGRKPQRTHDQSQSLFLHRLPYEIRRQIYEYVLASPELLHVVDTRSGRLGSVRCFASCPEKRLIQHKCTSPGSDHDQDCFWQPMCLSLLYSCRQIYSESVDVLYTKNTLAIEDGALGNLPKAMLPHRLTSIRNIRLETFITSKTAHKSDSRNAMWKESNRIWMDVCQFLSEMGTCDLQKLEVRIALIRWLRKRKGDLGPNDDLLLGMLNPLLRVKVPEFRVILDGWPQQREDVLRILGADPPFSIDTTKKLTNIEAPNPSTQEELLAQEIHLLPITPSPADNG